MTVKHPVGITEHRRSPASEKSPGSPAPSLAPLHGGPADGILRMQRAIGNRAVSGLLAPRMTTAGSPRVQRVDISALTPANRAALVAAYRTDATRGDMWGRESDLAAMARWLHVKTSVLDFTGDPGSSTTNATYSYGDGRQVYLKYTGAHYDVLEPNRQGLYRLDVNGVVTRFRLAMPIAGDGNCMFASMWYAAYPEVSMAYQLQRGVAAPPRLRVDQGQAYLRDFCHGAGNVVPDIDVEHEITAMDANNLEGEHIGPALEAQLDANALRPPKPASPKPLGHLRSKIAPKGPPVLSQKEATEEFKTFRNPPDYWAKLRWTKVGADLLQAELPAGSAMFMEVQRSVSGGIKKRPYKSASGEQTRMEVVKGNIKWLENKAKAQKLSANEQEQLDTAKERLKEGQKGGPEAPRSRPAEIERIVVIANRKLWNAYQAAASSVRDDLASKGNKNPMSKVKFDGDKEAQLVDKAIAEVRLFHSTSPATMDLLVKGGFNPAYSANKGKEGGKARYGPLGQGSYFADVISKAMTYSQCPVCSDYDCAKHKDEVSQTLLTRVVLGNTKKAHSFAQSALKLKDLRADDLATLKQDRHTVYSEGFSVSGNAFTAGSGLNEYGVKDASLVYPEFRIYYKTQR